MAIAIDSGRATIATVSPAMASARSLAKPVALAQDGDELRREQLAEAGLGRREAASGRSSRTRERTGSAGINIATGHCRAVRLASMIAADRSGEMHGQSHSGSRLRRARGPQIRGRARSAGPGPARLRVRHHAIGVNYIDTYFRTGLYPAPSLPFVPRERGRRRGRRGRRGRDGASSPATASPTSITLGSYAEERLADVEVRWSSCRTGSTTTPRPR